MARDATNPSVPFPPPRRGYCHIGCPEQAAGYVEPADEIDVFHDRQVGIPADRLEHITANEQPLIAVRQRERRHTSTNAHFDQSGDRARRIESEAETARHGANAIDAPALSTGNRVSA